MTQAPSGPTMMRSREKLILNSYYDFIPGSFKIYDDEILLDLNT